jgi:ribosomal protein S27AE
MGQKTSLKQRYKLFLIMFYAWFAFMLALILLHIWSTFWLGVAILGAIILIGYSMRFKCPKCHKQLEISSLHKFCPHCGASLEEKDSGRG